MSIGPTTCVSVPRFGLQLLHREKELPAEVPLVIVRDERPTARILECNRAAAAHGVAVGMAYSQALTLTDQVRAGVISEHARMQALSELERILSEFSPAVERWDRLDGVFWLSSDGLDRLFGGDRLWERQLGRACHSAGWMVRTARGWTRPGSLTAVLEADAPSAFPSSQAERAWMRGRPLSLLPLDSRDAQRLELLAVARVGQLLDLTDEHVRRRFARSTRELRAFLAGSEDLVPVQGVNTDRGVRQTRAFEPPIRGTSQLMREIERAMQRILTTLLHQGGWVQAISIEICTEAGTTHRELIRCGRATREFAYLRRLIDLRFERVRLERGRGSFIQSLMVDAEVGRGEVKQGELGLQGGAMLDSSADSAAGRRREPEPRDGEVMSAGVDRREDISAHADRLDRTVATLQAELGAAAVGRIELIPGRFPENRFIIVPLAHGRDVLEPGNTTVPGGGAHTAGRAPRTCARIRRLLLEEGAVPPAEVQALRSAPPVRGPFLVGSEWWRGKTSERIYEYRLKEHGEMVWGYMLRETPHARRRRAYHLQGWVQ